MDYLKWIVAVWLVCGCVNTGSCMPSAPADLGAEEDDYQGDDYDYDGDYDTSKTQGADPPIEVDDIEATRDPPYFEKSELELQAKPGDDVLINCDVRNFQVNNVVMWYRDTTLIVNGQFPLNHRAEAMKNNSILIRNVQADDAGDYYCEVLPGKIRLHASLQVGGHLTITCDGRDVTDKSMTFRQGESHTFECRTYGAGTPQIKWSLNGKRAANIVTKVDGGRMYIDNIDAEHAGIYQCLGDDGTDDPPHGMVNIAVQYSPKVSTHRHHVNAEEGARAELYCDYKADPIAITHWVRNGDVLGYSNKHSVKNTVEEGRNRTILVVKDVDVSDLGEYHCEVENTIGSDLVKVYLIYEPEAPQFENMSIDHNRVTLHWLVRSLQPLSEAVLDYKMNGAYTWSTVSVIHTKRHPENHGMWKLTHDMELVPGSWHARVKTKNTVGWSKFSLPHEFRIMSEDGEDMNTMNNEIPPQDMVMAAGIGVKNPSGNSGTSLKFLPAIVVTLIAQVLFQMLRQSSRRYL